MPEADPTTILRELPEASHPPEGEPHDHHADTNLADLHPYIISPAIKTLDLDMFFYPTRDITLDDLNVEVSAHLHGVSHAGGPSAPARFPYVSSCIENKNSPLRCLDLKRIRNSDSGDAHCVSCRIMLNRMPLGVSAVTLTVSGERLNKLRSVILQALKLRSQHGRTQIGHKTIGSDAVLESLQQVQKKGGTLTLAAVVMNCGWWHLYTSQSFFANPTAREFIERACFPRPDQQLTKTERLLTYMQMFKPLTRKIKITALEAFQLPLPQTSFCQKLMCSSNKPYVQSRIMGLYPDDEDGHSAAVSATSYRPNTRGRAEFKPGPWVTERVMASDPRRVDVVLMSRPDGASDTTGGDMQGDPNFLGYASFQLAQVWELLAADQKQYECRLQLKLEPRAQCTGSVVVRISVEKEDYVAGVQYRQ